MKKGTCRPPATGTTSIAADVPDASIRPGSRAELKELSDNALLARFRGLPRDCELRAAACEILVDRYQKLVRSCVRQYRGSPEPTEDLMQVGYVGLLKAINNYDPEVGESLSAYPRRRRDDHAPRRGAGYPRPVYRAAPRRNRDHRRHLRRLTAQRGTGNGSAGAPRPGGSSCPGALRHH